MSGSEILDIRSAARYKISSNRQDIVLPSYRLAVLPSKLPHHSILSFFKELCRVPYSSVTCLSAEL